MSATANFPADPFRQYGLQLVEEPAPQTLSPHAGAEEAASFAGLGVFHWGLLAGFATLQLAYCLALVQLARWAVGRWIGA